METIYPRQTLKGMIRVYQVDADIHLDVSNNDKNYTPLLLTIGEASHLHEALGNVMRAAASTKLPKARGAEETLGRLQAALREIRDIIA